ncbi:hypothetical protein ACJX0J_034563, partial [Zea mays]
VVVHNNSQQESMFRSKIMLFIVGRLIHPHCEPKPIDGEKKTLNAFLCYSLEHQEPKQHSDRQQIPQKEKMNQTLLNPEAPPKLKSSAYFARYGINLLKVSEK